MRLLMHPPGTNAAEAHTHPSQFVFGVVFLLWLSPQVKQQMCSTFPCAKSSSAEPRSSRRMLHPPSVGKCWLLYTNCLAAAALHLP